MGFGFKGSGSSGAANIDVLFNSVLEGSANATIPLNVNLTDGIGSVTPTSIALTGNDLDIVIPTAIVASGVLFKTIEPSQYTSYRTGDEGWRVQNGWFDYIPPSTPKAIAELDFASSIFCDLLKNNLVVNGVSSKNRFVDAFGAKIISTGINSVVIDKLTGMAYQRLPLSKANWNAAIDDALTYSITVNSIVFDDWYLPTNFELLKVANYSQSTNLFSLVDLSALIFPFTTNFYTSTTNPFNTLDYYQVNRGSNVYSSITKLSSMHANYITNARNLITAP
jgi:hypothetical protein